MKRTYNWAALGLFSAFALVIGMGSRVSPEICVLLAVTVPSFILARQGKGAMPYAIAFSAFSLVHTATALCAMTSVQATRFLLTVVLASPVAAGLGMVGYLMHPYDGRRQVGFEAGLEDRQARAEIAFFLTSELNPKEY